MYVPIKLVFLARFNGRQAAQSIPAKGVRETRLFLPQVLELLSAHANIRSLMLSASTGLGKASETL
jgi:hypothetical protein